MKISKLFHWLYALIMLLPIGYIMSRCLYVVFNDNATATFDLIDTFTMSVNAINSESIFSWAQSSFLVVPFQSLATFFSLPTTSPIITLLSYWLTISIIWLCFDVIMYVPLLVHRWLDKGIIE